MCSKIIRHIRGPGLLCRVYTKYAFMFSMVASCDTVLKLVSASVTYLILTNHSMHWAFCGFKAADLIGIYSHIKLQCTGKQKVTTI
jgi:hypothetical protein